MLNIFDFIAFNYNTKLIAAIISLISSYCYLELTGMQIAATRAFIMAAIVILAIITERSSYPLRSIVISATIILCVNPEYIFHPSFQLSFIAVLSLIAGYEFYLKNQWILGESKGLFAQVRFYIASNIYSSFLASIVTAPVVINQFYIFSTYSIPMNLIAVPIMSFFLMPLAITSLFLMPFGLSSAVIKLFGFFIGIITGSASFVNQLPGAVWYFGYITPLSIITFLFGLLWVCLWQTRWRIAGVGIMLISFVLMLNSPKPDLIVDANLGAVGVKNKQGKLEIYADNMPSFNRQYWAHWFGQADSEVFSLKENVFFVSSGHKVAISCNNKECNGADIEINISGENNCTYGKVNLDKEFLKNVGTILIFCNFNGCKFKYDNNTRFVLKH